MLPAGCARVRLDPTPDLRVTAELVQADVERARRVWGRYAGHELEFYEACGRLVTRRTRWTTVQRADEVAIDGVQVRVRHPAVPDWERQDVRNDDSIVIETAASGGTPTSSRKRMNRYIASS